MLDDFVDSDAIKEDLESFLTPAWPNLKYFHTISGTITRYQPFTDINLSLPFTLNHDFSFTAFMIQEKAKIFEKLFKTYQDSVKPFDVYARKMEENGVPYQVVVPFNGTYEYTNNSLELTTLLDNYFFISNLGPLNDRLLIEASVFKTHYKLGFVLAKHYFDITVKFTSFINQLHVGSCEDRPLKRTLEIFPEVKELSLYIRNLECIRDLEKKNFEQLQFLTVYIDQNCLIEFIQSLHYVFKSLKLEKSIAPITFSYDVLIDLDEALIFESGWKLLKPYTNAELYQQVGTIIQDTIVRNEGQLIENVKKIIFA